MAWTRNFAECGSDEEMRWLALHLSLTCLYCGKGEDALGLLLADWPGRNQLIQNGRINYLLDGAHTEESIKVVIILTRR